jgi:hypothetical protein
MADQTPLPVITAWAWVARCVVASARLLARPGALVAAACRAVRASPTVRCRACTETVVGRPPPDQPFLSWASTCLGAGGDLFRYAAQHPTLRWLSRPISAVVGRRHGLYRGLYQWDGAGPRALRALCDPGSGQCSRVHYRVLPSCCARTCSATRSSYPLTNRAPGGSCRGSRPSPTDRVADRDTTRLDGRL